MDAFSLRWAIELLVLPPGGPLLLAMLGLVLGWRRRQSSLAFGVPELGLCHAGGGQHPVPGGRGR
jgi:hypothetical protein